MSKTPSFSKITIHPSQNSLLFSLKSQAENGEVILGKQNLRYDDFVSLLYEEISEGRRDLSPISQYILVHNLVNRTKFKELYPDTPLHGLSKMILTLMKELWEASVTPEDLENNSTEEKQKTIAGLMRDYRAVLSEKKLADFIIQKESTIEKLKSNFPFKALSGIAEIDFKNIYNITQLDFLLISYLSNILKINITLPYDPYRQDAFRFLEHTIRKFENLGENAPNITLNFSFDFPENKKDLKSYLTKHLFKNEKIIFNLEKHKVDESVEFHHALNAQEEVKYIIKSIKSLLLSGIDAKQIAVCFRNIDKYKNELLDESYKYGVPIYFSSSSPVISSPLISVLMSPFKIIESGFEIQKVINLLSSDFISCENLTNSKRSLTRADMELLSVKANLIDDDTGKLEISLDKYINRCRDDKKKEKQLKDKASIFKEMIETLRSILKPMTGSDATARDINNCLHELFGTSFFDGKGYENKTGGILCVHNNILTKAPDFLILRENLAVFEVFKKACKLIYDALLHIKITVKFNMFYNLMQEQFRSACISSTPDQSGVAILKFEEIADSRFDYLFAGGFCEGEFPSLVYENILLSDDEKRDLFLYLKKSEKENRQTAMRLQKVRETRDLELLEDVIQRGPFISRAMKYWEESMLFLRSLSCAEEKIHISWHKTDFDGDETVCSYFVEHALSLIQPNQNGYPQNLLNMPCSKNENILYTEYDILNFIAENSEKSHILPESLKKKFDFLRSRSELEDNRNESYSGKITDNNVLIYLKQKGTTPKDSFSASALEDYAHCPFLYFIKKVLYVEKNGTAEREMAAMDIGTVIHRILEKYFKGNADEQDIESIVNEVFAEKEKEISFGDFRLSNGIKKALIKTMKEWLEFEKAINDGFSPSEFEYKFGISNEFQKQLFISGKWETVYFQGSIDRIDISGDAVKIIDYKNSKGGAAYDKKLKNPGVKGFQLLLYENVAKELLKKSSSTSAYAFLKKLEFSKNPLANEEFKDYFNNWSPDMPEEERRFQKDLSLIIEKIKNGDFKPSGEDCDYCDFACVCRYKGMGENVNE